MARGTSLQSLIYKFRAETLQSTSLSTSPDSLPHVKQLLARVQRALYNDPANDWAFLRMYPTKSIVAGSRYYDAPSDLNIDRIEEVKVIYNGEPLPVKRGISFDEYALYDPTEDERSSPILRWDLRWTGSTTQLEVWPLPSEAMTLMFKCLRPLRALVALDDVADLDDDLIVLFAAAEELNRTDAKMAKAKLAAAQQMLNALKAGAQSGSAPIQLGLGGSGSGRFKSTVLAT